MGVVVRRGGGGGGGAGRRVDITSGVEGALDDLGLGTSDRTKNLEDTVVVRDESVAQFRPKILSGHGLQHIENGRLVLKCACMGRFGIMNSGRVDDEAENVGDRVGGDERGWLVVG